MSQFLCFRLQGVRTKLEGETMLNFLEKLVYMILPNQIGFEGIAPFQVNIVHAEEQELMNSFISFSQGQNVLRGSSAFALGGYPVSCAHYVSG